MGPVIHQEGSHRLKASPLIRRMELWLLHTRQITVQVWRLGA